MKILMITPDLNTEVISGPLNKSKSLYKEFSKNNEVTIYSKRNIFNIKVLFNLFFLRYDTVSVQSWGYLPLLLLPLLILNMQKLYLILSGEMGLTQKNKILKKILIFEEKAIVHFAKKTIVPSIFFLNILKNKHIRNKDKFIAIPNGVYPLTEMHNARDSKYFRIIFVGGTSEVKGYSFFMNSIKALKVLNILKKIEVYLVGASTNNKIEKEYLKNGIVLIKYPMLPHKNVFDLYIKSDLFILPSHYETFAHSVLEAMACNLKIIISNKVGIKDYIENVDVVEYGNENELCDKIIDNFEKPFPDYTSQLSTFYWSTVAQQYLDVFKNN